MNIATYHSVVVIPSLEPKKELITYVKELIEYHFKKIIIVDDGSGKDYSDIFLQAQKLGATVLTLSENHGKGYALKTAFKFIHDCITNQDEDIKYIITADSDGQHLATDVANIAQICSENKNALILGSRDFNQSNIPSKSLFGNKVSSFIIALLYGKKLPDTQSGLRGFSAQYLTRMINIRGDRFNYEIRMLIDILGGKIEILTPTIKTIYENNNKGTHFKPLRDSISVMYTIFSSFILFSLSSIVGAVVDITLFTIIISSFAEKSYYLTLIATIIARIFSIFANYILNKKIVFSDSKKKSHTLMKYLSLSAVLIGVSSIGVFYLENFLSISPAITKIIVDTVLFLFSYKVQKRYVFIKGE